MRKLIAIASIAAIASGCTTVYQNDGANDNLKPAVVKDVVHAKYSLGQNKVSASDTAYSLLGFIRWGSSATHVADNAPGSWDAVGKAKNGAYANACDKARCDEIAAAHYKVTCDDYFVFTKATAEVTGYPATLTGVELIENKNPACGTYSGSCMGQGTGIGGILSLLGYFL